MGNSNAATARGSGIYFQTSGRDDCHKWIPGLNSFGIVCRKHLRFYAVLLHYNNIIMYIIGMRQQRVARVRTVS
jgi:hypothetical protein